MITLIVSALLAATASPAASPMDHGMHHPMASTAGAAPAKAMAGCCPPPCCNDMGDKSGAGGNTAKPAR